MVLGTIPAGVVGLIFRKGLGALFADFHVAAVLLILNGVLLAVGEFLRRRRGNLRRITLRQLDAAQISRPNAWQSRPRSTVGAPAGD